MSDKFTFQRELWESKKLGELYLFSALPLVQSISCSCDKWCFKAILKNNKYHTMLLHNYGYAPVKNLRNNAKLMKLKFKNCHFAPQSGMSFSLKINQLGA